MVHIKEMNHELSLAFSIISLCVCPSGELGSVYQTPCVVFTGHPTLRCGDAVHFMETWGSSSKNAVIFTGEEDTTFVSTLCMCVYGYTSLFDCDASLRVCVCL